MLNPRTSTPAISVSFVSFRVTFSLLIHSLCMPLPYSREGYAVFSLALLLSASLCSLLPQLLQLSTGVSCMLCRKLLQTYLVSAELPKSKAETT